MAVEFIEVFKNETEYLHAMITATQEKVSPRARTARDGLRRHCHHRAPNEAEWQFKADHTNEAILDRIVVVKVPATCGLRGGEDLPEDHPPLTSALTWRTAIDARDRADVMILFRVSSRPRSAT